MIDAQSETTPDKSDGRLAIAIYALYLVSFFAIMLLNSGFGITPLVGVIIAYVARGDNPIWVESHYRFQIVAFWLGLVAAVTNAALTAFAESLAGLFVIAAVLWWMIRNARGLAFVVKGKAIPDPASWGIGGKNA